MTEGARMNPAALIRIYAHEMIEADGNLSVLPMTFLVSRTPENRGRRG
jgi:hypothetical protein